MRLPAESSYVGRTIGELEAAAGGEATVIGIIRERFRRYAPDVHWTLLAEDVLVLQGDAPALQRLVRGAGLEPMGTPEGRARHRPADRRRRGHPRFAADRAVRPSA